MNRASFVHPMFRNLLHPGLLLALAHPSVAAALPVPYSHGNPSADEQYMLELINRARTDPAAEGRFLAGLKDPQIAVGIDFYDVDLARLKQDFNGYPVRPPLAFNASLLASSRRHSLDMAVNGFQNHIGSDGSTIGNRTEEAGYAAAALNENIYSNLVPTALFCHAGLNIDWGPFTFGVQPALGHRKNIMGLGALDFREIGIGISTRTGASAAKNGKLAVTQDFGTSTDSPDFLLGVAYYDVNGNNICDPGEGLSGIQVVTAGGSRFAVTSASGGYAVPFSPAPGDGSVTFSGGGLETTVTRSFSMSGGNVKVDLRITSGGPFVSLRALDSITSETGKSSGDDARFLIKRVGPTDVESKVVLSRPIDGSAGVALPRDYEISAAAPARMTAITNNDAQFAVVIPKNRAYAEIRVAALKDKLVEPVETAVFTILASKGLRRASPASVAISITR